LTKKSNTGDVG